MAHFIAEQAIFQEAEIVRNKGNKAIFRMILQTLDEINQNKRLYPNQVTVDAMENCRERMLRKSFYGEMDHPIPKGNQTFDAIRQTQVALERVSHYIRDYDIRGNLIYGEIETASTPKGEILLGLLNDRSGIGMSMRGLAELERLKSYNVVKHPLLIVSYDSVSLPSHKSAVVDFNEMKYEAKNLIQENKNLICYEGECFLPNYFDKLVETKIIEFTTKWV
jgi:hypothetical protein